MLPANVKEAPPRPARVGGFIDTPNSKLAIRDRLRYGELV